MAKKRKSRSFSPIGARYKTQRDFESAAQRRAKNIYRPQLKALLGETDTANSLAKQREGNVRNYYGAFSNDVGQAYNDLQSSLNNLITKKQTSDATGQATLQAALQQTQQADQQQGQIIGGQPAAVPPVPLTMGTAAQAASNAQQSDTMANILKQAADQKTMVAGSQADALTRNSQLLTNQLQDISTRRQNILASRGQILQQARDELTKQEQERQSARFQQKLAGKEFKLKESQFEHQKSQDALNNSYTNRRLDLEAQRLQADIDNAKTTAEAEEAQRRADQHNNAVAWISSYMAPATKREKKTGKVKRDPGHAFSYLKRIFGLSAKDALWIVHSMPDPVFRAYRKGQ